MRINCSPSSDFRHDVAFICIKEPQVANESAVQVSFLIPDTKLNDPSMSTLTPSIIIFNKSVHRLPSKRGATGRRPRLFTKYTETIFFIINEIIYSVTARGAFANGIEYIAYRNNTYTAQNLLINYFFDEFKCPIESINHKISEAIK